MRAGANLMIAPTKAHVKPGRLFIGGEWREATGGGALTSINPATGSPLTQIADAGAQDVDMAVRAARAAFEGGDWPKMSGSDRGKLLRKLSDLVMTNRDELAELETLDQGKPIFESGKIDMPFIAEML